MKIIYDTENGLNKYVGIQFTDSRARPDITVIKLADSNDAGAIVWLPASIRVQPTELQQHDTYVLIAALHLALAEAAKLDAQYPVGSEVER